MRPWILVVAFCWFISGDDSCFEGNEWAQEIACGPTICSRLSQEVSCQASDCQGSYTFKESYWCTSAAPQLERPGVFGLGPSGRSLNGLAMQPMPHLGVHSEGAVHRMWSALVHGMEEAQWPQIAKSKEEGSHSQDGGERAGIGINRGTGDVFRENTLDSQHSQFTPVSTCPGDHGTHWERGRHHGGIAGSTRAHFAQAPTTELFEDDRALEGAKRSNGTVTERFGDATSTPRDVPASGESAQSCPSEPVGQTAAPASHTERKDSKVGHGLETVCLTGDGEVQQAQRAFCGDSQAVNPSSSREASRVGSSPCRFYNSPIKWKKSKRSSWTMGL